MVAGDVVVLRSALFNPRFSYNDDVYAGIQVVQVNAQGVEFFHSVESSNVDLEYFEDGRIWG